MDRQLFDLLKTPQQLNWLEAALIRDVIQEGHEFEEAFGVSVESAKQILFAWEAAQSSEWNRELLCQFIDPEIFPDRRIVQLRVEAAMRERFTPTAGLHWLKEEGIPVGDLDEWVRKNTATPAPVEPDKAGPLPLTTNVIANCFAGFREWDLIRWKRELGSPDKWLQDCRFRKGTRGRGGHESTWWPVQIAVALVKQDQKAARHLRARFKRLEQLKPWLENLEINIPDNSGTP